MKYIFALNIRAGWQHQEQMSLIPFYSDAEYLSVKDAFVEFSTHILNLSKKYIKENSMNDFYIKFMMDKFIASSAKFYKEHSGDNNSWKPCGLDGSYGIMFNKTFDCKIIKNAERFIAIGAGLDDSKSIDDLFKDNDKLIYEL